MEEIEAPNNNTMNPNSMVERKLVKPQNKDKVNCPRCNSTNTKFCYYNNYSQTQPRYFCKTCRRYWTHGGSLRNVPVGGGSRKKINKRSSPSISSSSKIIINPNLTPPNTLPHLITPPPIPNNNKLLFQLDAHDLNLAFPIQGNISNSTPMVPMSNSQLYPSGFPNLHEFKGVFSSSHGGDSNGARLLFPFADMNKLASSAKSNHHDHQDQDHDHYDHHHHEGATGYYWSGMLDGGTW